MNQLAFDFDQQPALPEFCGPWMFLLRAEGEFIRFCQTVTNRSSINSLAPASWSGFYSEARA